MSVFVLKVVRAFFKDCFNRQGQPPPLPATYNCFSLSPMAGVVLIKFYYWRSGLLWCDGCLVEWWSIGLVCSGGIVPGIGCGVV